MKKKNIDLLDALGPILTSTFFLLSAFWVIKFGHPHEDAYILYIFSEQWAENGVISYFDHGPPAEGATDFLWMALIALLNRVGINSAIAAMLLNAAGIFVATSLILRLINACNGGLVTKLTFLLIIPFYSFSQASLAGFSTSFYCAISLAIFVLLYNQSSPKLIFVPLVSILLGLVRPEGVIIGVTATILGFALVERNDRNKYLASSFFAASVGLIYFAFRWNYFGHFLPLPLYVKSSSEEVLPGLNKNLRWMAVNSVFILSTIAALLALPKERMRLLLAMLPVVALFILLLFTVQSQNIALRFQAPIAITLMAASAVFVSKFENLSGMKKTFRRGFIIFLAFATVPNIVYHADRTMSLLEILKRPDYINYFPYLAQDAFTDKTVIALTEAGRFAYWVKGQKYDLIGLCTAETAIHGADKDFVKRIEPDVLFIHTGKKEEYWDCKEGNYCEITDSQFSRQILDTQLITDYTSTKNRIDRAQFAAFDYLLETPTNYTMLIVKYGKSFKHFYAFKENGNIDVPVFLKALQKSFEPKNRYSYLDMIRD